ncbi:hypothetical protein FPCIR_5672 [Fusarium pseudocircinatum]|uniref:Uncharacterized protein n=1 Tax=Fusarium pseudocircinatum TaxID=56676 RepID=A0A8H5UKP2_9HYPO|nr:hypothetical protein FPCIR_5672 [Fusarium pseudocircinatum]
MSVDHHSEQPLDIIMADANTMTAHPEDYRDQSATAKENRGEVDMKEMLSLTTQIASLSTTSANLTRCISEPPKAHDRGVRRGVAEPEKGFWAVLKTISQQQPRMLSHHNLGTLRYILTYEIRLPQCRNDFRSEGSLDHFEMHRIFYMEQTSTIYYPIPNGVYAKTAVL